MQTLYTNPSDDVKLMAVWNRSFRPGLPPLTDLPSLPPSPPLDINDRWDRADMRRGWRMDKRAPAMTATARAEKVEHAQVARAKTELSDAFRGEIRQQHRERSEKWKAGLAEIMPLYRAGRREEYQAKYDQLFADVYGIGKRKVQDELS